MSKRVRKICPICGKVFETYPSSNQTYCSKFCGEHSPERNNKIRLKLKGKPSPRKGIEISGRYKKICPVCNKEFKTLKRKQIHCSQKCSGMSPIRAKKISLSHEGKSKPWLRKERVLRVLRICPICRHRFKVISTSSKVCCSLKCSYKLPRRSQKLREGRLGKKCSKETREKQSLIRKRYCKKHPEHLQRIWELQRRKPTKPEKTFSNFVDEFNLPYRYTGNNKFRIENINPDFVNINGKKEAIEIQGCFFHGCKQCYPHILNKKAIKLVDSIVRHDKYRDKIYKKYGWKVIKIWEHEINDNSFKNKLLKEGGQR